MKTSKLPILLTVLLAGFFLLWTAAEAFFALGRNKVPEAGLRPLRAANRLFPLLAEYQGEAGFALMEKGQRDDDADAVKASLPYFQAALRKNPLDYRSRFYLARAYLRLSSPENSYFERGIAELQRAARIRGTNKQIVLDCCRLYFSMWPLLEEEDQAFAARLLSRAMALLSWEEFAPLVEMWSLYVQDAELLQKWLARRPDFYGPAADKLVAAGIPLDWRWQLLDRYEQHSLETWERLFDEKVLNGQLDAEQALHILRHLNVRGYFRLQPESRLDAARLYQLQRELRLTVLSGMIAAGEAGATPDPSRQPEKLIEEYVSAHGDLNSLGALQKLLESREYFKTNDFHSLRMKTLIAYKKGDYANLISEIEALRQGISFVKKEQAADYTDILLLLVDSYYNTKLLTKAEEIAGELVREQPDNQDVLWRVLRIRKILGSEGPVDADLEKKLAAVENSRILSVAKPGTPYYAYLFNQPDLEITIDAEWRSRLQPSQLLQVFVDDQIAYESYVKDLPEKIVIGAPFVGIESKAKVQVNIL